MSKHYLRDLRADAAQDILAGGQWVVAGVQTTVPWPRIAQIVVFEGLDFIIRPSGENSSPTISLNAQRFGLTAKEGRDRILRFGSALAWSGGNSFEVFMWTGGTHAFGVGRMRGEIGQDFLDPESLPSIPDDDAATALAFYREGLSIQNHFYAFLSFFKVISFIHRDGKQREAWFEKILPALDKNAFGQQEAIKRIDALRASGINVSQYLWDEGRNAIAHAEKDIFVNPDKTIDHDRIYADLPILRVLARKAIEEKFNLWPRISLDAPQASKIAGLEQLLGGGLVELVAKNQPIPDGHKATLPDSITLVMRGGAKSRHFEHLHIASAQQAPHALVVRLINESETLEFIFAIDCVEKKLVFEPFGNSGTMLNKSSRASINLAIDMKELIWIYLCNGHMELWDDDTDELLGESDVFMLVNQYLEPKAHVDELAALKEMHDAATQD